MIVKRGKDMLDYREFCGRTGFDRDVVNTDAMRVFDFFCQPEVVHSMIVFSEVGLPAFSGIAKELERDFADAPLFPLRKLPNRQIVGKMAKFVLGHFGYEPIAEGVKKNTKLREFSQAKLFGQSAIYTKTGRGQLRISMTLQ